MDDFQNYILETHTMKKFLFGFFLICLTQITFANVTAKPSYHSETISIQEALQKSNSMVKGIGPSTNIIIINYTNDNIWNYPQPDALTHNTARRITSDWTGPTLIQLTNGSRVFWTKNVGPMAMISIHSSYGQYVVYETY